MKELEFSYMDEKYGDTMGEKVNSLYNILCENLNLPNLFDISSYFRCSYYYLSAGKQVWDLLSCYVPPDEITNNEFKIGRFIFKKSERNNQTITDYKNITITFSDVCFYPDRYLYENIRL